LRRAGDVVRPRSGRRRAVLTLLTIGLLLALAFLTLNWHQEAKLQRELAETHAREATEATAKAQAAAQQAQEASRRLAELEQAATEAAAAESAAAPGRDEFAVLEAERLVTLAINDLQLTRHTATALAALELADARLAAANAVRWAPLRRALARDMDRLRAIPNVDITGIALRLDQLIAGADLWPLASTTAAPPAKGSAPPPASPATPPSRPALKKAVPPPPPPPEPTLWERVRAWVTAEFGDLLRINEVSTPEALLLTGEQEKLLRQQLKLRLLGARVALLSRSDRLYRADIENAQMLLALYYEQRNPAVASAAAALRQLNTVSLAADLPTLADSQAALRAARTKRP
jgi:uroporphyrin-3 C-methyltransferase/uroporphyrinogen III methyltransferase/synthase